MSIQSISTRLLCCLAMAGFLFGCDGGSGSFYDDSPDTVSINFFDVYGNGVTINGREQVVATIKDGVFKLGVSIDPGSSDDASIFISDKTDILTTTLEQQIVKLECDYYPFCVFDLIIDCKFGVDNQIICGTSPDVDKRTKVHLEARDITPMMISDQTDLFVILVADAKGLHPAQINVPVTFRHN